MSLKLNYTKNNLRHHPNKKRSRKYCLILIVNKRSQLIIFLCILNKDSLKKYLPNNDIFSGPIVVYKCYYFLSNKISDYCKKKYRKPSYRQAARTYHFLTTLTILMFNSLSISISCSCDRREFQWFNKKI